ncbi:hypothetical protein LH462_11530 [Laribacter hongkongensis]|jgi:hypothetical protein|uniref:Uncharacterized protein n=3 Tax=Laribacter hongkongensis TaxID=168471 RepID=C1DBB9_LARHH|nr:hypothetical protein [Laribacter hongkongensis]ACO73316.1 hypothetical protein LHK_00321 [Laribacter hongkongensis HLHK9]MCG9026317.1 hypothetical protein [Laribacter hongkongensis]MCG9065298.1 hypothetical protein [Laribacter hongkongensis]MCG9077337.1 hypothetical protein [Laribacter hongkongensis]MCG9079250.1 hypothetical protein [Laribacter hongkongensis]
MALPIPFAFFQDKGKTLTDFTGRVKAHRATGTMAAFHAFGLTLPAGQVPNQDWLTVL